jgi:glycerol-3-phosphate acyltransferase PlsY
MSLAPGPTAILLAILGGYLLGSVPFGLIITRLGGAGDVRQIGSGNIGATNVLRTGRRGLAFLTLLGDGGKGAVAVLLFRWLAGEEMGALAGGAAFFGHIFPVWLGFKGGKGVATFFGVLLAACWPVGLAAAATWLGAAFLFRYSSLGALSAAALSPLYALAFHQGRAAVALCLVMAVVIYSRHRANIERLLKGTEPRIGAGKAAPPPSA